MGFKHCGKIHNLIECVHGKKGKTKSSHIKRRNRRKKYDERRRTESGVGADDIFIDAKLGSIGF
jgi:hypothetical protein